MKLIHSILTPKIRPSVRGGVAVCLALAAVTTMPAAEQYFAGDGSALTASKYGTSATGPFTSAFTSGNIFGYGNTTAGTGTGGSIQVGGFDITQDFTLTSASGTITTGGSVVGINVADGKTFNLGGENLSTAAGTGFIKNGNGVFFSSNGNQYGGGFTLNAGTVIVGSVNALGGATGNTLTINGGIIASNATRDLTGKYTGGIIVGGNFQLGAFVANSPLASDTANLTFSNNIALGTATTRTITLGNKGNQTLGGIISGTSGLTFAAVTGADSTVSSNGVIAITGTANTFTGAININGPEATFAADGSLGNSANTINIEGGRFTVTATSTITAARGIQVGSTAGTSISAKGSGTVITYNGVIANLNGETGTFAKQGGGTLALGGVSTYSGDTAINNGTLQLTIGNNRLPTGTTVSVGQATSTNVGAFDLNGLDQQVAGLNSVTGTNTGSSNSGSNTNTVTTSTGSSILTLGGSGTYAYGDATAQNTGTISGAVTIKKINGGTQTFGASNSYTGGTQITGGSLLVTNTTGSGTGSGNVTVDGGSALFGGTGTITGPVMVGSAGTGGTISAGLAGQTTKTTLTTGALTLGTGSTFNAIIAGDAAYGTLAASGTSNVTNAAFSITVPQGTTLTNGETLTLITSDIGTSQFTNLSYTAGGYNFLADYTTNPGLFDVDITPVPEPATVFGGILVAGALGWNQRRRLRGMVSRLWMGFAVQA